VTEFEAVVGLEIHAQLLTASKVFCGCSTAFGAPPNSHVCPVCLGLPGALPVLNGHAVDLAVRAAVALGCTIERRSIFARKNYFYPDLPKGYQISQYEQPLATGGVIRQGSDHWGPEHDIRITRVHLEEDAGKLLHEGFSDSDRRSYVDLNRAGTPLIEIVTEPDIRSARDAAQFFLYLWELVVAIGVNDGNMEEGSLRCDANVSVRRAGSSALGTKTEIKNLNSFRYVEKALEHEIARQIEAVRNGGRIVSETRLWDPDFCRTVSMRSKEQAHDYRYFPEPDLAPLLVSAERVAAIRSSMRELPAERRRRLAAQYAVPMKDAVTLTQVPGLAEYFEDAVAAGADLRIAKNWLLGPVLAKMNELGLSDAWAFRTRLAPPALAELLALIANGKVSSSMAKEVLERMLASGGSASAIVAAEGLAQIDDESHIVGVIADVLGRHVDAVEQYRAGKNAAFGFLVGQVMKGAGGRANPRVVNELLRKALG
jgi:aspartyl-tRNA(Asn)/glutamyl-tRNA(Gln) amidotransferase subunit B